MEKLREKQKERRKKNKNIDKKIDNDEFEILDEDLIDLSGKLCTVEYIHISS